MHFYAVKRYHRDTTEYGNNELLDVIVSALFTTREQADTYIHLTPDVELEIQGVQVSGSIDLGGMEIVRD